VVAGEDLVDGLVEQAFRRLDPEGRAAFVAADHHTVDAAWWDPPPVRLGDDLWTLQGGCVSLVIETRELLGVRVTHPPTVTGA
jgi:hypothetical protein